MTTFNELMDRWNTDEGRPYKGSLIDMEAYEAAPDNIGCMCAQGQVLHLLAGWTPDRLNSERQAAADAETARLLKISLAHTALLRIVNDTADGAPAVVLINPGAVLGDQWSKLLDFWRHLDGIGESQWYTARTAARTAATDAAWYAASDAAWDTARAAARAAAWYAASDAASDAAMTAAWYAASDAAMTAAGASGEIQGADVLRKSGKPLLFLPAFGFAAPEDIPARPDNYGPVAS